jgi:hypothetical protein
VEVRSVLPATWEIPQVFRQRLGDRPGRQRTMLADGHLLLVLHKPPSPDDDVRQGRYFWRKPDGTWTSSDAGSGIAGMQRHMSEFGDAIQVFDAREQEASTSFDYFGLLEGLAPLHRAAEHMHQVLQEARKLVPEDRSILNFRDQSYDLARTADLLYTNAKNGLDFAIARRAEEEAASSRLMAVSSHRLNILVAFFFPLATLSGVFGMNFSHGMENMFPTPWPLIVLVGAGLIAGAILALLVTRAGKA